MSSPFSIRNPMSIHICSIPAILRKWLIYSLSVSRARTRRHTGMQVDMHAHRHAHARTHTLLYFFSLFKSQEPFSFPRKARMKGHRHSLSTASNTRTNKQEILNTESGVYSPSIDREENVTNRRF